MNRTAIAGTGACLPDNRLPSAVLERRLRLASGTIAAALGVQERRIAAPSQAVSDLAVAAGAQALAAAGVQEVDLLVLATSTPDHPVPATAPQVAHRLGLACPAFDLMNTCSGWLYAVATADRWIRAEGRGQALVIGANVLTRRLDWEDWSTAGLFGDGAGAVVLRHHTGPGGVLATTVGADGSDWRKIMVPAGGSRAPMTVQRVQAKEHLLRIERRKGMLQDSARRMADAAREAMRQAGWQPQDVDRFVPHQANARLIEATRELLGIDESRTERHIHHYGNMSAASIPVALHEAGPKAGERVLMAVVAGGTSTGAAAVEWSA